jgi:hypothetical protein
MLFGSSVNGNGALACTLYRPQAKLPCGQSISIAHIAHTRCRTKHKFGEIARINAPELLKRPSTFPGFVEFSGWPKYWIRRAV